MNLERGGGCLIAVRNSFVSEPFVLASDYNTIYHDYEFIFVKIICEKFCIIIGVVYFPPTTDDLRYHEFFKICRYIFSTLNDDDLIFVFGDFNRSSLSFIVDDVDDQIIPLNFTDPLNLPDAPDFVESVDFQLISTFYASDIQQINRHPNSRNKWLDLIFSNAYEDVSVKPALDSENLFKNSIHHSAVTISCPILEIGFSKSYNNEKVYDFKNANYELINFHLNNIDWFNIFQGGDINSNVGNFYKILFCID